MVTITTQYGTNKNSTTMKRIDELKKGDVVSCISRDSRSGNVEATVKSIGRKYITVDGVNKSYSKYERETLVCADWSSWELFPGTLDEYAQHLKDEHEREETIRRINRQLQKLELSQLKSLTEALQNILTPQSKG